MVVMSKNVALLRIMKKDLDNIANNLISISESASALGLDGLYKLTNDIAMKVQEQSNRISILLSPPKD
jgi:hypothetical protein